MKLYTLDEQFLEENDRIPANFTGISIKLDGPKVWWQTGFVHRVNAPAVEWSDGTRVWYNKGLRHRIDGAAIERLNGTKAWYIEDRLHCIGGPAIDFRYGQKYYYIHGKSVSKEYHDLLYSLMRLKKLVP